MTVQEFFEQYTSSPLIRTVYVEASVWDSIPQKLFQEFKAKTSLRKDSWDWLGKQQSDDRDLELIGAFYDKSKRISFNGQYGIVEFKRRG